MRARILILAAGLLGLAAAPAAQAQTPAQKQAFLIYADYIDDGKINPCDYTGDQLKLAQSAIPPDVRQYATDLPGAIQAAIAARARGDCANGAAGTPVAPQASSSAAAASTPTSTPTPKPTPIPTKTVVPEPPGPAGAGGTPGGEAAADPALERAAATSPAGEPPIPLLLLGALALLLALTALVLVALKRLGWAEGRLAPVRHSWREAAWRFGGTWEDFRDWLRVGR